MPRDKRGHFYYGRYPTIWKQDTSHLTLAEDGAYGRLIDEYMVTRHPIPSNDRSLARIVGVSLEEWITVKDNVLQYFKPDPRAPATHLLHNFCERELKEDDLRIETARVNGRKGGKKKKYNQTHKPDPRATLTPTLTQPSSPQNRTEQHRAVVNGKNHPVYSKLEINDAKEGDPAYDPEVNHTSMLPGGWFNYGKSRGLPHDRIYKSWEKFMGMSINPFSRKRWQAWMDREG